MSIGALVVVGGALLLLAFRQNLYALLAVIALLSYGLLAGQDITYVAQDLFFSLDQEVLLSIPFFVLAGTVMSHGTIAARLVRIMSALTAPVPGGLAMAAILSAAAFAATSGSSMVTLLAVGGVVYPFLVRAGYPEKFSLGTVTASGTLGIIVPPSIPLILYGISTKTSIVDLFLAGIAASLLLTLLMISYAVFCNRHRPVGRWDSGEIFAAMKSGGLAMGMPVIILGGLYGGVFTATESAVVATVYAILVEVAIHRDLKLKDIAAAMVETAGLLGTLVPILAFALSLNMLMAHERVPQLVVQAVLQAVDSRFVFLLVVTVLLLIVGCLVEITPAVLLLAPILAPLAQSYGVDPVHFGIIMIVNLEIGYLTPPFGLNLFVASTAFKKPFSLVMQASLPYIAILFVGLLILTFVPAAPLIFAH